MSIEINVITGRKKAFAKLLKEVAEFIGGSSNKRISTQVTINMNPKDTENKC